MSDHAEDAKALLSAIASTMYAGKDCATANHDLQSGNTQAALSTLRDAITELESARADMQRVLERLDLG